MKFSIRLKVMLMILAFSLALGTISVVVCANVISNRTEEEFKSDAKRIVWTVSKAVDSSKLLTLKNAVQEIYNSSENKVGSWDWGSDAFNEYVSQYKDIEKMPEYTSTLLSLREMAKINDVSSLYFMFLDKESNYCVYVIDSSIEEPCPVGCIDELYGFNTYVFDNMGNGINPYITNTEEYGWLVTAGAPVIKDKGEIIGLLFVDISMEQENAKEDQFIKSLIFYLTLGLVIILIISIIVVEFTLIRPIKKLTKASKDYCDELITMNHTGFKNLKIKTHDEIEDLTNSMKKIESDINEQVNNLVQTYCELAKSKEYAKEMVHLANVDALTGLRNKTSYDHQVTKLDERIKDGSAQFGIAMIDLNYLKKTNDTYGHKCGDEALIKLGNLIKSTFTHSPIFRIGGDEFVVVLKGKDYENNIELINSFKEDLDKITNDKSLQPWLRISAAVGYSSYSPDEDKETSDVFKKADDNMYANKREMKMTIKYN